MGYPSEGVTFERLQGDGSARCFWRLHVVDGRRTFIAMENAPTDPLRSRENLSTFKIGRHLHGKGLPVPQIHRFDEEGGWFILEDLGRKTLHDLIMSGERTDLPLYKRVLAVLIRMQLDGGDGFETGWCYQTGTYDRFVMRRYESEYFRDAFLRGYLGLKEEPREIEGAVEYLAGAASRAPGTFFIHRDFQSRNIMIKDGRIGIVDWQGGRLGPLEYDVASLLIDPYVGLGITERTVLYGHYLELLGDLRPELLPSFERHFPYLAIQRNLQILGAFSHLCTVMGKPFFEPFIRPALGTLHDLLRQQGAPELGPLTSLTGAILSSRFR
jgi:aminoglycoside/choline kinase family phosphotransferase